MDPSSVKKDGRPFGTTRVLVETVDLHQDYGLDLELRRITPTGRLDILAVYLRADPDPRLAFIGRWDEAEESLDFDPPKAWSRTKRSNFLNSLDGYGGHHPTPLPDRHFDVNIQVPIGVTIFLGVVSFGFAREMHLEGDTLRLTGGLATFKVGRVRDR